MKIYLTDEFLDFMKKTKITEEKIIDIADELVCGLHDGELVHNELYKKRIPLPGQGKRGSCRGIIAVKSAESVFFMDGWRKSDIPKRGKEIPDHLLDIYKMIASDLRNMTQDKISDSIQNGLLIEVCYG